VMTKKCPTCGGDGIVYSEASAAIDVERRLRSLVAGSRSQAYRVELAEPIATALIGAGARRLLELEALTKRKFFLEGKPGMHLDHFVVVAEGKLADLAPEAPVAEGAEVQIELVEVDRHDGGAAVGKVDGFDICVADAASLVGKRVKVRIERVLDGIAYASLVRQTKKAPDPLTAEGEAEKPTRKPPARKEVAEAAGEEDVDEDADEPAEDGDAAAETAAKKKTRRGSRGGRNRKKTVKAEGAAEEAPTAEEAAPEKPAKPEKKVTIHLPAEDLGEAESEPELEPVAENGADPAAPAKKKTRRGSRGGKNRRKRVAAAAATTNGSEPAAEAEPEREPEPEPDRPWGYVPMSEWGDEFEE
jgi:ribonuclease E